MKIKRPVNITFFYLFYSDDDKTRNKNNKKPRQPGAMKKILDRKAAFVKKAANKLKKPFRYKKIRENTACKFDIRQLFVHNFVHSSS